MIIINKHKSHIYNKITTTQIYNITNKDIIHNKNAIRIHKIKFLITEIHGSTNNGAYRSRDR